jgi:hypothetical protein
MIRTAFKMKLKLGCLVLKICAEMALLAEQLSHRKYLNN